MMRTRRVFAACGLLDQLKNHFGRDVADRQQILLSLNVSHFVLEVASPQGRYQCPLYLNPTHARNVPQSWYTRNSSSHRSGSGTGRGLTKCWLLDTDSYNRTAREQLFGEPVEIRAAATTA